MKNPGYSFFIFLFLMFYSSYVAGQVDNEFWFVAPEVNDEHGNPPNEGQPTFLRISTDSLAASVKIYQPAKHGDTPIYEIDNIPPFSTRSIKFRHDGTGDYDLGEIENELQSFYGKLGNITQNGLKIESTTDVTAYYEIAAGYNYEILSLKGDNALGKEFYVPFQTEFNTYGGYDLLYPAIDIVATANNTDITINPTAPILLISSSGQIEHTGPITKTLQKGETFSVVPYGKGANTPWKISRSKKLDGTKITSNKSVAVQTKDDLVADGVAGIDYVADQLVPVNTLGTDYIINRGELDTDFEYAYVVATDDNTEIRKNGNPVATINAGETKSIKIDDPVVRISSQDSSIYVFHVSGYNGSSSNQFGGAIIPTVSECTGSTVVPFVRTSTDPFYINLLARDGATDNFILNGDPGLITDADFTDVTGPWSAATIDLSSVVTAGNPNIIKNTEDVFHIGILNGDWNCYYGYFSEFQQVEADVNMKGFFGNVAKICHGDELQLWSKGATIYKWEARTSPSYLSNPTSRFPIVDPTETKEYRVIIEGFCNLKDTSRWAEVRVADPLIADFTTNQSSGCSPFEVTVKDTSIGVDFNYNYDFGDGTVINTPSLSDDTIKHVYKNTSDSAQNPKLELVVKNKYYCKDTLSTDFVVYPEISSAFEPDTTGCSPFTVAFDNQSSGDTSDYRWKFGDGAIDKSFEPSHTYINYGSTDSVFNVSLLTKASNNICTDTSNRKVRVYPHVEADYTIDKVNGCSPLTVVIRNVSTGEDSLVFNMGNGRDTTMKSCDSLVYTYKNSGISPDTNRLQLKVWNEAKCMSIADTTEIIVYPEIDAQIAPYDTTGCNQLKVDFKNYTNYPATNFSWDFGDGTSSTDSLPIHTYKNLTDGDTSYLVIFKAESEYGCKDDTSAEVHIRKAKASFNINKSEGCSPLKVLIDNQSKGSVNSYNWSFGDGTTDFTGSDPGMHIYKYNSGGSDTSKFKLFVEGNGSCRDTMTRKIITYSAVNSSFKLSANSEICSPDTIRLINQSSSWASDFDWELGDGSSSSSKNVTHEYLYSGVSDTSYNVRLNVLTPFGCRDDTLVNNAITVYPSVNANFSMDIVEGCSPVNIDLKGADNPAISDYHWDFDNGNNSSVMDPPKQKYINTSGSPITKHIRLSVEDASGNCKDTTEKELTVFSEVEANFKPGKDTSGCNPLEIQFSQKASAWAEKFKWDFNGSGTSNEADPSYTFVNNGAINKVFNVALEVETKNGCKHDTIREITVHPYIRAAYTMNQYKGCSPLKINAKAIEYGGIGTYQWNFDNGVIANGIDPSEQQYINNGGGTDKYDITLSVTDKSGNCKDDTTKQINVWSSLNADFSADQLEGCNPLMVEFTDESSAWTDSWKWDFGNGSSSGLKNPKHEFINPNVNDTIYQVKLMTETRKGCKDTTDYSDIMVYSYVNADFTITDNEGCPPFTTSFVNHSTGNMKNTYEWHIDGKKIPGAPSDTSRFTYTFRNNTDGIEWHEVKLIARNEHGCRSVYSDSIRVYQKVNASMSLNTISGCNPLKVEFTDLSTAPKGSSYTWDFGDGASSGKTEPKHLFYNYDHRNDKSYTTQLTVSSPFYCKDDTSVTITVHHQPKAKFDIDETSSCPPLNPFMKNQSIGYDSFEWRFGDSTSNSVSNTITHEYQNNSNIVKPYDLELFVSTSEGCRDSAGLTLNVFPNVKADFVFESGDANCHPFVAELQDSSLNADTYYWNFGDGNTSGQKNPVHRFTNISSDDVTYSVSLKATSEYNCQDTIVKSLTVYAQPEADFHVQPQLQKFPESKAFITNKSNEGPWSFYWYFDDGNTDSVRNPNFHQYEDWGDYDVTLEISSKTSHCSDSLKKSISILPPEVRASYQLNKVEGCEPLTVEFEGAPSIYNEEYSYNWDFGDGKEGEGRIVKHTFDSAGIYYVKMVATGDGGTDHTYDTVQVFKKPIPDFEVEPKLVMLPDQKIHCFNLSEYGEKYLWKFGDGSTSAKRTPKHLYSELGAFDVTLRVESANGCIDSIVKQNAVEVKGKGMLKFPTAFTPAKSGPTDGRWKENEQDNNIFHPVGSGIIEYKLQIFNKWGEKLFESEKFQRGWDGYYQGKLLPQDVYVWKVEARFSNGEVVEKMGDVTLIR